MAANLDTNSAVFRILTSRNLTYPYSKVLPKLVSPTLGRLKDLAAVDPPRYQAIIRLIDTLLGIAKDQKVNLQLTLYLPSLPALRTIDVERLMQESRAMSLIIRRCYLPTAGKIDLRPLVSINTLFTPGVNNAPETLR